MPVIDADELARLAVAKGSDGLDEVVKAFGPEVLDANGDLDRKKLAAIVFGDDAKRKVLNGIVHPRVTMLTFKRGAELRDDGHPLACYEAALIIENVVRAAFRPLIVVAAPEDVQVARAAARDKASAEEVRARIRAQMPLTEKIAVADYVIENTGTLADLEWRTDDVLDAICRKLGLDPARYPAPRNGKLQEL